METEQMGRKARRDIHEEQKDLTEEKVKKVKMKGNICTFCTKFSWFIIVIAILGWFGLYKINGMMGTGLTTKTVIDDETGEVKQVIVDDPKKDVLSLLFLGTDEGGYRTDTLIYIKYDTVHDKMYMMSIPRDTYIPGARYGYLRINTLYEGGKHTDYLIDTVEDLLGVAIDYYAVVNIPTIWSVVDILGGIEMTIEEDVWKLEKCSVTQANKDRLKKQWGDWEYDMSNQGLWYPFLRAGTQTLNSKQIETLARNRDYGDGNISRDAMQRKIIVALVNQLTKPASYAKIPRIITTVFSALDTNFNVREAMKYVDELKTFDASTIVSQEMVTTNLGYYVNNQSVVLVDAEASKALIKQWVYKEPVQSNPTTEE